MAVVVREGLGPLALRVVDTASSQSVQVDVSDAIAHLLWRFVGGEPPHAPFATCGFDRTEDGLGECNYSACEG